MTQPRTNMQRDMVCSMIDWIEKHLADDLTVDMIAERAGYSKWHFQRVFHAISGNTVKGYIVARRLSECALALRRHPNSSIGDVAAICGYSCQQGFSRAFKLRFGITPCVAQKRDVPAHLLQKPLTADDLQ